MKAVVIDSGILSYLEYVEGEMDQIEKKNICHWTGIKILKTCRIFPTTQVLQASKVNYLSLDGWYACDVEQHILVVWDLFIMWTFWEEA